MDNHYHYIIAGAGCAGSSLLMRMMADPFFNDKKILVIDQSPKTTNDRTWCFWEKENGIFENIVHHRWNTLQFFSEAYAGTMQIEPYQYKMIRGIDLYESVKNESAKHTNIEWRSEKIKSIRNTENKAVVALEEEILFAEYVFNSILFQQPEIPKEKYFLLQHFKGWLIETERPCFDPSQAVFMDFRTGQKKGTAFFYVLPTSATRALVEYTLFSKELLEDEKYEAALGNYISSTFETGGYKIVYHESGAIPMTNISFPLQEKRIVKMGIAGGQVKGSSGYAFRFIQKRTDAIVASLIKYGHPFIQKTWADKKFHLYDSVLLNVLSNRKMRGDAIFSKLFQQNDTTRILKFLDNETGITEDLSIMRSVPSSVFLPAAWHELFS